MARVRVCVGARVGVMMRVRVRLKRGGVCVCVCVRARAARFYGEHSEGGNQVEGIGVCVG